MSARAWQVESDQGGGGKGAGADEEGGTRQNEHRHGSSEASEGPRQPLSVGMSLVDAELFHGRKQCPGVEQTKQDQEGVSPGLLAEADVYRGHGQQQGRSEADGIRLRQSSGETEEDGDGEQPCEQRGKP